MNVAIRGALTPTQAEAQARHQNFHRSIAEKAEALRRSKLKTDSRFEAMASAMQAECAALDAPQPPAETSAPETRFWFEMLPGSPPTIDMICRAVCKYYGLRKLDFLSERRPPKLVRARQIAMYLANQLTRMSYPKIGQRMGDRDHSTIYHGVKLISGLMLTDSEIAYDVAELFRIITGDPTGESHEACSDL